jgi:hypothetical protein
LEVRDFKEDESVCFDRDLDVLIMGCLRVGGRPVLGVYEDTTGDRIANGRDAEN